MDSTLDIQLRNLSGNEYENQIIHPKNNGISKWTFLEKIQNEVKHTGFDYTQRGILNKVLSPILFIETKREKILNLIDFIWVQSVNDIKQIKKTYNYTFDRNYFDFN